MGKFIMEIDDEISDEKAAEVFNLTIKKGKVSKQGKSYCLGITFGSLGVKVNSFLLKSGTHKFRISKL